MLNDLLEDEDTSEELKQSIIEFENARKEFLASVGLVSIKTASAFWEPIGWKYQP